MKRDYTIEVTAEDIANGERRSLSNCPIARTIRRVLGPNFHAVVRPATRETETHFMLPDMTRQHFIEAFDAGEVVKPFSFTLTECRPSSAIRRSFRHEHHD